MQRIPKFKSDRLWRWLDRLLLALVLALQIVLLRGWSVQRQGGDDQSRAVSEHRRAAVAPSAGHVQPVSAGPVAAARAVTSPRGRLFSGVSDLFELALRDVERPASFDEGWERLRCSPAMDMRETEDHYLVLFSLPGVQREEVDVSFERGLLTVESPVATLRNGVVKRLRRQVRLPGPVAQGEEAWASLTNGVLRICLPKAVSAATNVVELSASAE